MTKIIFISHGASRSGAPLYLLNLAKWININYNVRCLFLLETGGELENEFKILGETIVWKSHYTSTTTIEKIISKTGVKNLYSIFQTRILKNISDFNPDLVVSNTIVSNKLAFLLKRQLSCPFVAIYHEMKFSAEFYYREYLEKKYINIFDKIISVNENIKQYLLNDYLCKEENVFLIPPFISNHINNIIPKNTESDKFNILLSGFGGWQKGFDLLGALLANFRYRNIHHKFSFTWLGEIPGDEKKRLEFELIQIGASDMISFPGIVSNMEDYYLNASIFLSLSKEDSFPLACIEAASYGLPVLAFEKSGGIVEFIKKGGGEFIPFLDLDGLVNKIVFFASDKIFYSDKAKNAKKIANEYNIDTLAPKVINVLLDTGIILNKT